MFGNARNKKNAPGGSVFSDSLREFQQIFKDNGSAIAKFNRNML